MKNFMPELRTKLDIVEVKFFINHFYEFTRGADEAYAVISQQCPQILRSFLRQQVDAGCWIIEEGHIREALFEIMHDVMQTDLIRYYATVLYDELEEDGLLEKSENITNNNEHHINFSNEDTKEAITDLLLRETTAPIDRIVEQLRENEYCIKAALMELMEEGLVNFMEGQASLSIGYELKDNLIVRLAHRSHSIKPESFSDEYLLNDEFWDDDEEFIYLEDASEVEETMEDINVATDTDDLPFTYNWANAE